MELIRKIVIGQNPKDAMAYFVGQRAGGATVDSIVLDDRYLLNTEFVATLYTYLIRKKVLLYGRP